MIEEWCGAAPGRYIPLMLIPMWDPQLAVDGDASGCAAKGATTFAFSENPTKLGLPSIHDKDRYWDPVFAAANELELVVSMHVGSSSQRAARSRPTRRSWPTCRGARSAPSGAMLVVAVQRHTSSASRT